jgi:ABC transporter substrate binding protein
LALQALKTNSVATYARASKLLTDFAYHWPPRGVLMPRALRASAIWWRDVTPLRCISRITGSTLAARRRLDRAAATTGPAGAAMRFRVVKVERCRHGHRSCTHERPDAVFLGQDAFFNGRRLQLANWAARHALPMISGSRDICEVGALMSYGSNIVDSYRQEGVYVGRILKGAKPADLPVEQSAKFELVINAQTARMLGLDIPPTLLARADEVID